MLRYVSDEVPGIRRVRSGRGFAYVDPSGRRVRDEPTLMRIARLAVPPAYRDVWICPREDGHIQATARDARGRKQYRYHTAWRAVRDATKYARLLEFAASLPELRSRAVADLGRPGMPKEKVLAAIVTLLEATLIRIGNEEYARANDSFGLTTLRRRHVRVNGTTLRFQFKGKSGVVHNVTLQDRRLARIVAKCQEIPGQHLFSYVTDDGNVETVDSGDVNEYIRAISGDEFSAKDFRTWLATVSFARFLTEHPADDPAERKKIVVDGMKAVAHRLGNTPAVCRKCYVHPLVERDYLKRGSLTITRNGASSRRNDPERSVLRTLKRLARAENRRFRR